MYVPVIATAVIIAAALWLLPLVYYKYIKKPYAIAAEGDEKCLLLTFDDGPDGNNTEMLLDLLALYNVKACFFLLADKAEAAAPIVERMLSEGHCLGFHSISHRNMLPLPPKKTAEDFRRGLEVFRRHNWPVTYYRPPYGAFNLFTLRAARRNGLQLLLWNVIPRDWLVGQSSNQLLQKLFARVEQGAVILLHDASAGAKADKNAPARMIEALNIFIPEMQKRGYRFVTPEYCRREKLLVCNGGYYEALNAK